MNLREALIVQSPSLALQREAQAEIARLDHQINFAYTVNELVHACLARGMSNEDFEALIVQLTIQRMKLRPTT